MYHFGIKPMALLLSLSKDLNYIECSPKERVRKALRKASLPFDVLA